MLVTVQRASMLAHTCVHPSFIPLLSLFDSNYTGEYLKQNRAYPFFLPHCHLGCPYARRKLVSLSPGQSFH